MPRFDLFSKQQADAARAGQADVYSYDVVPMPFRVQLMNIAGQAFGSDHRFKRDVGTVYNSNWIWVDTTYSHEKGIDPLGGVKHVPDKIRSAFRQMNAKEALDFLSVVAKKLYEIDQKSGQQFVNYDDSDQSFIGEVNYRLREAGMGYQYEQGRLIRMDSKFVHQEVFKPALSLLAHQGFEGAQQEFLQAHEHYRKGLNKEAINMAASALESTFKAIFDLRKWEYPMNPRISDLMKVAKSRGLWPEYLDKSFEQLVATLQSGLPQIRDKVAAHGQGSTPKEVPSYLAAYALHLAASKIVFLVSAAKVKQ